MAQSLYKIYLHIIFHTKTESPTVDVHHLTRIHEYIGALVNSTGCQVVCVGGTCNHVHTLLMLSKTETVAHVVEKTKQYVMNQQEHHKKVSFHDEYIQFLKKYNIDYDERYVFSD